MPYPRRPLVGRPWHVHFAGLALVLALLPLWVTRWTAAAGSCETTGPQPNEARLPLEQRALLAVARELPLGVKIGQLLMPGFLGTTPDAGLLDRARRGHVGGFFLLQRNVRDAPQLQELTTQLSSAVAEASLGLRPLLATDFEGGIANALRPITGPLPSAAQLAAGGVDGVRARGIEDAETLRWLGFNTNLAPVADVLTVPSTIIGPRAFSSDPAAAAALSRAYLRGLQDGGVLGVLKHFPGHGATAADSHVLLPVIERSLGELESVDLVPYRQAFAAGEARAVMVGHLLIQALDPNLPATLSPAVVGGLLRDRLAFDGLVMTDELKMAAISRQFGVGQAAVMSLSAGVDVILADYTGLEQDMVEDTLARACAAGEIPAGRLEQSVARVLRLKLAHNLAGPEIAARYAARHAALGGAPISPSSPAPVPPQSGSSAATVPDWGGIPLTDLPGSAAGRFYPESVEPDAEMGALGYSITDEGGIGFWQSYAAFGGPAALGYPLSQRFELDGSLFQLTQRALLRWDPEQATAVVDAAFERLDRLPLPATWLVQHGVPASIRDDGAAGDYRRGVATRLSWLTNDAIRDAFLANPDGTSDPWPAGESLAAGLQDTSDEAIPWAAIERNGLPMSRPERFGPFLSQRFQRVTLQLWLDDVAGMPPAGTVTPLLTGELLRTSGLIPPTALVPERGHEGNP